MAKTERNGNCWSLGSREKHTEKSKTIHRAMTCLWDGGVSEPCSQMSVFQVALSLQNPFIMAQSKSIVSYSPDCWAPLLFFLSHWVVFSRVLLLCNPMNCSTSGFPVLHCLLEFAQTHVHWVSDAIQPSNPLSLLFPLVLNLSQHQGLFQWVSSLH